MFDSDDKDLKSLLQSHQPEPPPQSKADSDAVLRAIQAELFEQEAQVQKLANSKSKSRFSGSWLGATGFIAATLVATVITSRTVSTSPEQAKTLAVLTGVEAGSADDGVEATEDEAPSLEVGQDWLDLVAAY